MKRIIISLIPLIILSYLVSYAQKWEVARKFSMSESVNYNASSCDSMTFIFPERHFAPDSSGCIYWLTEDYGETWRRFFSTVHKVSENIGKYDFDRVEGIQMFNKNSVYLMHTNDTNETYLYKTFDAGKSWDTVRLPVGRQYGNIERNFIYFKNPGEGIVSPHLNYIFRTTDGGESWTESQLPTINDTLITYGKSSYCTLDSVITVEFEHRTLRAPKYPLEYDFFRAVLYSLDYGKSWRIFNDNTFDTVFKSTIIKCRTVDEYWAACSLRDPDDKDFLGTQIRISKDRGQTWKWIETKSEIIGGPTNIHFFDDQIVLLTSRSVYRTFDEGKSWIEDAEWDIPEMESAPNNHFAIVIHSCFATPTKGLLYDAMLDCLYKYTLPPVSVENENRFSEYSYYPNPTRAGERVNFDIPVGNYEVEIFDMSGRCIQKSKMVSNSVLIKDYISSGVYFFIIESDGKLIAREKFIVK